MSERARKRQTVMVAAFDGWNDACQASTNVIRHLVERYESTEVRSISCDGYYDYQVSRPMVCHVAGRRRIVWPQTTIYDITLAPDRHLFAQIAPEPNYRWAAYCRQSLAIAEELDVNRVVTLGAMFADCPHTRPLPLSVSEGECQCEDDRCYDGPVGIPTVLDEFARQAGFDTTSMWVAVPQYLDADECAQGTMQLLNQLSHVLGIELDAGDLERKAREWGAQADVLLHCNDALADYVRGLERDWDRKSDASHRAALGSPEAEQLVREAEAYLKGVR